MSLTLIPFFLRFPPFMVAEIDVFDKDSGENGKLNIKITRQKRKWAPDDDTSLNLFEMSKSDKKTVQFRRSLTESDVGPYLVDIEVSDNGKPIPRTTKGTINIFINSVKKPLNQTEATQEFEREPDLFDIAGMTVNRYFRYAESFIEESGMPAEWTLVFIILLGVLLLLILCLMIWCCISAGCCCCCKNHDLEDEDDLNPEIKFADNKRNNPSYKSGRTVSTTQGTGYAGLQPNYKDQYRNSENTPNNINSPYDHRITNYDDHFVDNTTNQMHNLNFGQTTLNNYNDRGAYHESGQALLSANNGNSAIEGFYELNGTNAAGLQLNYNPHTNGLESNHGTFKRNTNMLSQQNSNQNPGNNPKNNSGSSNNNHTTNTSPGGQSSQNQLSPNGMHNLPINNFNANYAQTLETPMDIDHKFFTTQNWSLDGDIIGNMTFQSDFQVL